MKQGSQAWLSPSGPEPALTWMIVVSAIIHLGLGAAIFFLPKRFFASSPPPVVSYTVKIVDPSALGGRLPKGALQPERPPEPSPDAAPIEAKPEPKNEKKQEPPPEPAKPPVEKPPEPESNAVKLPDVPPKPEPKPQASPAPVPPKPEPKPAAKRPAPKAEKKPTQAELARLERDREIQDAIRRLGDKGRGKTAAGLGGMEEGKGAALGTGGDGGGGGVLMGLDFILYKNRVEALIKKNWTWVGANPDLTVRVGFQIQDDGTITDLRLVATSGDGSYDESVLRAIRGSSPLPPPPEKYRQVFRNYLIDFVSGELAAQG